VYAERTQYLEEEVLEWPDQAFLPFDGAYVEVQHTMVDRIQDQTAHKLEAFLEQDEQVLLHKAQIHKLEIVSQFKRHKLQLNVSFTLL
jgi:hypothetical protein